jgi:hypothetical protein
VLYAWQNLRPVRKDWRSLRSHNPRQAVLRLADLNGAVAASVRSDTTGTAAKRTSQSEEKQKQVHDFFFI